VVAGIKVALGILVLLGVSLAGFGCLELIRTMNLVASSSGRAVATFSGYHRTYHRTASGVSSHGSGGISVASYAEFTVASPDGGTETVREPKVHVFERYRPGQQLEVLLSPSAKPRLAGFYSLYFRDLLILLLGLGFLFVAGGFWRFALPGLAPVLGRRPAGAPGAGGAAASSPADGFAAVLEQRIGPVPIRSVLVAAGSLTGLMLLAAIVAVVWPYLAPLRFGAGGRLLRAVEEGRVEEARQMAKSRQGIEALDEYGRNALVLALEAGQAELARDLVAAGADVNVFSRMRVTPLRLAAEAGDTAMVRLLLERGALPQHPEDAAPPFLYAMANGHDEVARMLIESGTDLRRRYRLGEHGTGTVGDMAVLANKPELIELIRNKGGEFRGP
jgi:uncharacterized protein